MSAAALATASETPRIALAPSCDLSGVPSRSIRRLVDEPLLAGLEADQLGLDRVDHGATALSTPLPPYRSPPSRSSTASNAPVDAPLGTAARPASRRRARLDLDGRVAPGVEDLPGMDGIDARHDAPWRSLAVAGEGRTCPYWSLVDVAGAFSRSHALDAVGEPSRGRARVPVLGRGRLPGPRATRAKSSAPRPALAPDRGRCR